MITDFEDRIVYLNPAAVVHTGCSDYRTTPRFGADFLRLEKDPHGSRPSSESLDGLPPADAPGYLKGKDGSWHPATAGGFLLGGAHGQSPGRLTVLKIRHPEPTSDPDTGPGLHAPFWNPESSFPVRDPHAMLKSILDYFPMPFFTVDRHLVVTSMNQHLEELSGFRREEVLYRMTCAQLLATPECNTESCVLRQTMENRSPLVGVERWMKDREGRTIPIRVFCAMITDREGRVIGGFAALRDITFMVEAEQRIRLLIEMSQEGILMADESRRILYVNSKMAEMAGEESDRLVGTRLDKLLSDEFMELMDRQLAQTEDGGRQHLCFCSTFQPLKTPSLDYLALETCIAVSRVGRTRVTCLYFRDLTKHIEFERQLRSANDFLNSIIRSSVDGIVVLDNKGKVVIFNEGAERILGYKAEEVMGSPELFHRIYSSEQARENMRRMRSNEYGPPGKLSATRVSLVRKDGEIVPANFSAAIIKVGDREVGTVGIFSDLREVLRMRRELEEARTQLIQAEKILSLGRLAAGVAHEINNPLAGILIYADMLLEDFPPDSPWRPDLEEIVRQTLRCKEIVMRLLEFSRQPLGKRLPYDMNEVIGRCVELLRNQSMFLNIDFCLDLEKDIPPVHGDPGQIQQVFTNLILNAADAMGGRGRCTITSGYSPSTRTVLLKFMDTGPGIPKENLDKIFEPFFTTKPPGQGTGLGLSVAYGIVQQHGGNIEVGNLPDGGAVFSIHLPLEPPEYQSEILEG